MTLSSRLGTVVIFSIAILLFGVGSPCLAQSAPSSSSTIDEHLVTSTAPSPLVTPDPPTEDLPMRSDAEAATPATPQAQCFSEVPVAEASKRIDLYVGGWNTGSLLDYQFGAILGYRIKPAVVLQAGYRYLAVDYRSSGTTINTVTSGALFGATITLK
jgi:hypothetical protein